MNKGTSNEFRRSTRPEPLLPGKHAFNPPVVTVIGAGVSGLTAAHELVERGFLVQVVDATQDPYHPGRPVVGGMAANQRARVRANIEDLHRDLIDLRGDAGKRNLAEWLLWLFSLNRTRWIQTEEPASVTRTVSWQPPADADDAKRQGVPDIVEELRRAKQTYRTRWLWDLVIRSALIDAIRMGEENKGRLRDIATTVYQQWSDPSLTSAEIATMLLDFMQRGAKSEGQGEAPKSVEGDNQALRLPRDISPDDMAQIVVPAFEREFLCFRLIPRAVQGAKGADDDARTLLRAWMEKLLATPGLGHSLLVVPDECHGKWNNLAARVRTARFSRGQDVVDTLKAATDQARVVQQREPLEVAGGGFAMSWLQIEIIEQRLPGEHGYRFFPSFYRHLEDTMKRIPLFDDAGRATGFTVYDNLRPTVFQGLGMNDDDLKKLGRREKVGDDLRDLTDDPAPDCSDIVRNQDGKKEPHAAKQARGRIEERDDLDDDLDDDHEGPGREAREGEAGGGKRASKRRKTRVVEIHRDRAKSIEGFRNRTDRFVERLGGTRKDALLFFAKMFRYMTSSPERRRKLYEDQAWKDFIEIDKFSEPMQEHIKAAAQVLLAFSVGEADTRTYGNIATQLFLDQFEDGTRTDRTLNGPTSAAWLEPWRDYLERQGVRFFCSALADLTLDEAKQELTPTFTPPIPLVTPDFYVLALSLPIAADKIIWAFGADADRLGRYPELEKIVRVYVRALGPNRVLRDHARRIRRLETLINDRETPAEDSERLATEHEQLARRHAQLGSFIDRLVQRYSDAEDPKDYERKRRQRGRGLKDMTGVQYFFDAKTSIGRGHMYFPLTAWGLSSISQSEFWLTRGGFSDGYLGVLSVDVCTTGDLEDPKNDDFWHVLAAPGVPAGVDKIDRDYRGRLAVARRIWRDIDARIDEKDRLAQPRFFHLDTTIAAGQNRSQFLASTPELADRPGRVANANCVGEAEIKYELNFKRWVVCGTFMATHTRMTTMEAANESARHAARTILDKLGAGDERDPDYPHLLVVGENQIRFNGLGNRNYNGAWRPRPFDPPDVWNPEDFEMEDLDLFRRVDRRLVNLGLGHFMDIVKFDEKLDNALEQAELYEDESKDLKIGDLLGLAASGLDAAATKEYGRGYTDKLKKEKDKIEKMVENLTGAAKGSRFPDLKSMLAGDLQKLVDKLK